MIYYELNKDYADQYHDGVRYWASNTAPARYKDVVLPRNWPILSGGKLLQCSERVWQEDDDVVKFIKNRQVGLMAAVDMREFFLVKLQARSVGDTQL